MSMRNLCNDKITIQKASGEVLGPFQAQLSPGKAIIPGGNIDIEEEDKVLRELPTGKVESYTAMEVNYNAGVRNRRLQHYSLRIQKDSSLLKAMPQPSTNINITGSQGVPIGDYNTQNVRTVLEAMVSQIDQADAPDKDKTEAKSRLKAFLTHPLVTGILGGAAGGLASLL